MEGKTLHLPLIKKWFDMTEAEIKPEEYREITPFWMSRLLLPDGKKESQSFWNRCYRLMYSDESIKFFFDCPDVHKITDAPFTYNTMTLGYPKAGDKDRISTFEHLGIEIREGNPEWGAEPGKIYIVIKHGKKTQS